MQRPQFEFQHNNAPRHPGILPHNSGQSPRLELQHNHTPRHSITFLHNTRLATSRTILPFERSLILLRADEFGSLVLRTRLLNQRDEVGRIASTGHTLLEQLDEIPDVDAFFGNGSLDFFQRRQGDTSRRGSAGSGRGSQGSAIAWRARAVLEQCFLLRGARARCIGVTAGSVACLAGFTCTSCGLLVSVY
jgi:hypothetical protein